MIETCNFNKLVRTATVALSVVSALALPDKALAYQPECRTGDIAGAEVDMDHKSYREVLLTKDCNARLSNEVFPIDPPDGNPVFAVRFDSYAQCLRYFQLGPDGYYLSDPIACNPRR